MDRKIEKKKWPPKKIASFAAVISLFVVVTYTFIFGDSSSKLNVDTQKITIVTVKKGEFQEFIPVNGSVLPIKTIYLDAIEGGRVEKKFIEAGTFVNKGDKILLLANTTLYIQILSQEAQIAEQSNLVTNTQLAFQQNRILLQQQLIDQNYQVQRLKRIYKRNEELFNKKLISQLEFEQTKDEYDYYIRRLELSEKSFKQDSIFQGVQIKQLGSSLNRLKNNFLIAQQRLDELMIKAPVSGQLTSLVAEVGESKPAGARLGQIDILDGFKVRVGIDEHYLARINLGQKGEFDFAGKSYRLIIKKIFPEVINGRFEVDMEFIDQVPGGIRRGQTLRIRLELGDLSVAVLLSRGGFYQKTGGQWVYIIDESGDYAIKRKIKLGRQNPKFFEVLDGLTAGEHVITSTYDNFGDIDKLVLKNIK